MLQTLNCKWLRAKQFLRCRAQGLRVRQVGAGQSAVFGSFQARIHPHLAARYALKLLVKK
jgi:hypothetical protein